MASRRERRRWTDLKHTTRVSVTKGVFSDTQARALIVRNWNTVFRLFAVRFCCHHCHVFKLHARQDTDVRKKSLPTRILVCYRQIEL